MGAQKITIEPITRIEGHGRVTIHLNEQGKVEEIVFPRGRIPRSGEIQRRPSVF